MPWLDKCRAVIHGYLCGQAGAGAILKALMGDINPSGKLAESYPVKYEDVPSTPYFAYLAQSAKSLLFYTGSLWIGPDGELLPEDDEAGLKAYRDNQDIIYDLLYGEGYIADQINRIP